MPKGQPGGNPNILNIGKETRYKKGDPRAAEKVRKTAARAVGSRRGFAVLRS